MTQIINTDSVIMMESISYIEIESTIINLLTKTTHGPDDYISNIWEITATPKMPFRNREARNTSELIL